MNEQMHLFSTGKQNSVQMTKAKSLVRTLTLEATLLPLFLDTLTQQYLAKRDDKGFCHRNLRRPYRKNPRTHTGKSRQKMMQPLVVLRTPLYGLLKERYNEQQQLKLMKYMARVQDRTLRKCLTTLTLQRIS